MATAVSSRPQLIAARDRSIITVRTGSIVERAHVAQLAEHVLGKDEVTRSIRVVGSTSRQRGVLSDVPAGEIVGIVDHPSLITL